MNNLTTTEQNQLTTQCNEISKTPEPDAAISDLVRLAIPDPFNRASFYAQSGLVPKAFQGNRDDCLIVMGQANRLKLDEMYMLQRCYVVHGKPGIESKLAIDLATNKTRGPYRNITYRLSGDGDARSCVAVGDPKDGSELQEYEVTIADAKRAGWWSKKDSYWQKEPDLMLRYRSAARLIATHCPGVMGGLSTIEELRDMRNPDQRPTITTAADNMAALAAPEPERPAEPLAAYTAYGDRMDAATNADDMRQVYAEADASGDLDADQVEALGRFGADLVADRGWA